MKTEYLKFRDASGTKSTYVIPEAFQREYGWELPLCHELLFDIRSLFGQESKIDKTHFIGTILLTKTHQDEDEKYPDGSLGIIDGQQRIITLQLLTLAILHHAKEHQLGIEENDFPVAKMILRGDQKRDWKLIVDNEWEKIQELSHHGIEKGPWPVYAYFRHLLFLGDRWIEHENPAYPKFKKYKHKGNPQVQWKKWSGIDQGETKRKGKKRTIVQKENTENYEKSSLITDVYKTESDYVKALLRAIRDNITFNQITIEREDNIDQFTIFDRINAKKLDLSSFDIIKNLIKASLVIEDDAKSKPDDNAIKLWNDIEGLLKEVPGIRLGSSTSFVYAFLISRGEHRKQKDLKAEKVSKNFREHLKKRAPRVKTGKDAPKEDLAVYIESVFMKSVALWVIAVGYKSSVLFQSKKLAVSDKIFQIICSINNLSKGPAVPLVLMYLFDFFNNNSDKKDKEADLISKLELIEGYLIRFILSGQRMSPLRSQFMEFCDKLNPYEFDQKTGTLKQNLHFEDLKIVLKDAWISDETILNSMDRDIYTYGMKVMSIFAGLERKKGATIDYLKKDSESNKFVYSIEHIAPQNLDTWELDLKANGIKRKDLEERNVLHSIGNLSILSSKDNAAISNKSFKEKQKFKVKQDFDKRPVPLLSTDTNWVNLKEFWTIKEIKKREQDLIKLCLQTWKL